MKVDGVSVEFLEGPGCCKGLRSHYGTGRVIAVDCETTNLNPHTSELLLIQMASSNHDVIHVVDVRNITDDDKEILASVLNDNELILHNGSFDLKFFTLNLPHFDLEGCKVFDTMLAELITNAGRFAEKQTKTATSLLNTLDRRLGKKIEKETRNTFVGHVGPITESQVRYAAFDVVYLHELRRQQIESISQLEIEKVARVEFELVKHIARMELNGVRVDTEKWLGIVEYQEKCYQESYEKLKNLLMPYVPQQGLFGHITVNFDSAEQMLPILRDNVGLDIEDTTEFSLKLNGHEICLAILDYREHQTLLSNFGRDLLKLVNPVTGNFHSTFNQALAATGRFSSEKPNVQQIPGRGEGGKLRECFIPSSPDFKMLCADYSQVELRILAELSNEEEMISAYQQGIDIHTRTASLAFGIPLEEVKPEQRKTAKILNFAICYGGGATAITKGLLLEIDEKKARQALKEAFGKKPGPMGAHYTLAKALVDSYFKAIPAANEYLKRSGNISVVNRMSRTPLGRVRLYDTELERALQEGEDRFEDVAASVKRRGMNQPIQGCSADITKIAMVLIGQGFARLGTDKARMLLQVHDEIICEAHVSVLEEAAKIQQDAMEEAARLFLKKVPVKVDVVVADYWQKD